MKKNNNRSLKKNKLVNKMKNKNINKNKNKLTKKKYNKKKLIFSVPKKNNSSKILINPLNSNGNLIKGLRDI